MLEQGTPFAGCCAIEKSEIKAVVRECWGGVSGMVDDLLTRFASDEITPESERQMELDLESCLRSFGRDLVEGVLSRLEPESVEEMPGVVVHRGRNHRRLPDKQPRERIVTRFGVISLVSARYRRGRAGKVISPLEISLGIVEGFTPAAADFVGRQTALPGASQQRVVDAVSDRFGERIGHEKLRRLTAFLGESLESHREPCQREQLADWIGQVREQGKTPVLSVSRDGVSLGIQPFGFFEMASIATISVMSEGDRLGTVYIACQPEENQRVLSDRLTSLLKATLHDCGKELPTVVYVTDAGKIETAYWKNTLRHLRVDGRRIKVTRVVDYYHASQRLTTIADALAISKERRAEWSKSARKLLLEPGGWGRVMRSIAKMRQLHGYLKSKADDADKAERYLRRYRRFMNYAELKADHLPQGSGVVESACKQIVTERMKLSGMRWKNGAQWIMTLRSVLLSNIWEDAFSRMLASLPQCTTPVDDLVDSPNRETAA